MGEGEGVWRGECVGVECCRQGVVMLSYEISDSTRQGRGCAERSCRMSERM